jgi:signal recognition particle subunit SEC65
MQRTLEQLSDEIRELPDEQRSALEPAVVVLVHALMEESPRTLRAFVSGSQPSPIRARNRARLELLSDQVRSESLPGRELTRQTGLSRQRLQQLRDAGRLLGLRPPLRSEYWYPRWQFDERWNVKEVVPRLLSAAAEARLTPLGLHLTLTNPAAGIAGQALVELLDEHPDEVLESIAGAGEIGS